ncbi:MAG TPA: lipid-A-disaccharide synthase, partial [Rubrivivax sp.]|nr:lipid-A-disaccharide synthase [Rubrivivax sp.]
MRLAMVAGEASGDLLASLLIGGLTARWPAIELGGIGGPRMKAVGFDGRWPGERRPGGGYFGGVRPSRG